MNNEHKGQEPQVPVKRSIRRCDKCARLCLFWDDKCQGCRIRLFLAIADDEDLLEG